MRPPEGRAATCHTPWLAWGRGLSAPQCLQNPTNVPWAFGVGMHDSDFTCQNIPPVCWPTSDMASFLTPRRLHYHLNLCPSGSKRTQVGGCVAREEGPSVWFGMIEQDEVGKTAKPVAFCLRCLVVYGHGKPQQRRLILGGSSPRPPRPVSPWALSWVGPSCHLSNDFFILQEEPVARGNAPLPAQGKSDAGSRPTPGPATSAASSPRDRHVLSSRLCFFAFFPTPPSVHTVVGVTPRSLSSGSHFVLEGRKLRFTSW